MQSIDKALINVFTIFLGLAAGFFFAFTNPTMMGFANTTTATYVEAMQEINRAVRNGWFLLLFAGTLIFGLLAAWRSGWCLPVMAALTLYVAAVAMTQMVNVPMNAVMDGWDLANLPPAQEVEEFRARWMAFNTYRMIACILSFAILVLFAKPPQDAQT